MADETDHRTPPDASSATSARYRLAQQAAIIFGVGFLFMAAIALFWYAGDLLLLVFASILIAVLLHGAGAKLQQWTRLPYGLALAIVLLAIAILIGFAGTLMAPRIADQTAQLWSRLPESIATMQGYLQKYSVMQRLQQNIPPPGQIISRALGLIGGVQMIFSDMLGIIGNIFIVGFMAIYLAMNPGVYMNGILKLLPPGKRKRGQQVLGELNRTLWFWMLGKLVSMTIIGIVTGMGLALLGVPLALTLGVVAGVLDFIPYLGPIIAAIPAVLIAFLQGPGVALYVVLLFIGLQSLEGYLLIPLIERKTVSMPPALTISMQMLLGVPLGLVGVALATPMTTVLVVLVSMLYVHDLLGEAVCLPDGKKER